jgi:hypothetical protein
MNDEQVAQADEIEITPDVCWLEELGKHKPTENQTPLENFLTTALAWAVSDSPAAKECFLEMMFPKEPFGSFSDITVRTQEKIKWANGSGNGFLDIYIENSKAIGVIECKVNSAPDEYQIRRYEDALKKRCEEPGKKWVLSYLSRWPPGFKKDPNGHIVQWHQLLAALDDLSSEESPILKELREFMRRDGMTPPEQITIQMLQVLSSFQTHLGETRNLVSRVADLIQLGNEHQDLKRVDAFEGVKSTWFYVAQFKCEAIGEDIIQPGLIWGSDKVDKISLVVYIGGAENKKKLIQGLDWKDLHGWTNGATYEIPVEEVAADFCDSSFGFEQQAEVLANHVNSVLDAALRHLGARN